MTITSMLRNGYKLRGDGSWWKVETYPAVKDVNNARHVDNCHKETMVRDFRGVLVKVEGCYDKHQ